MPNSPSSPVRLEFAPDFKRNLRGLAKKLLCYEKLDQLTQELLLEVR